MIGENDRNDDVGGMDIRQLRDSVIRMNGLFGVDGRYTFYYDESNNVRKLHIVDGHLNVSSPACYSFGGIVHGSEVTKLDLQSLREALSLQANVSEIKLKHLGKGGFLDLLASRRVAVTLQWIRELRLCIHFQVADLLYWSIVDVIDSILAEAKRTELYPLHVMLKDALYTLLRDDVDGTAEMLGRYQFPNVGKERRVQFIRELSDLLIARGEGLGDFERQMLKGVLGMARDLDALPFLENEPPNVLVDGFGAFVASRLWLFKHSEHILDQEPAIQDFLKNAGLCDGDAPLTNWRFVDSKCEAGIQISDVVTGLLGKLFTYVNTTEIGKMQSELATLSPLQRASLRDMRALIDESIEQCPGFANYVISSEDQKRAYFLLDAAPI